MKGILSLVATTVRGGVAVILCALLGFENAAVASECDNLAVPAANVIWCDSFEDSDLPSSGRLSDNYFDYSDDQGDQIRVTSESQDGQYALRQRWQAGEDSAGTLMRSFGRNPVNSQSHSNQDFREIYWRVYVKYPTGFQGFPNKLSRATVFATSGWAQAMIAHTWLDKNGSQFLAIDPARGTDAAGVLQTTKWNDFNGLTWMGKRTSSAALKTGVWQCIESRVALNSPGASDGKFTLWVDDVKTAERTDLNWLGSFSDYALNTVILSGYWNGGAPRAQERYLDSFVIATSRIGCGGSASVRPAAPSNLNVN